MKFGFLRLGQAASDLPERASEAIASYDRLMGRVALLNNADARSEILSWIGRSDVPGSPAERYQVVASGIKSGATPDMAFSDRVDQLTRVVASLDAKVSNYEEAYGTLPVATAAGSTSEANVRGLVISGSLALLGLLIVPMLLD